MPRCWECSLVINNLRSFASHLRYHNKDSKDRAFCIEDECGKKQFANLSSLLRHYRTVHPVPTPTPPQQLQTLLNEAEPMHLSDDDVSLEHNLNDEMNSSVDSQEVSAEPHELPDNLNCVIASEVDIFISKLYKNKNITRGEVQEIINYTGGLLRGLGEVLRPVVFKVLERANASSDELYSMEDAFEILENPFENLRSEYMRVKTYKEEGTYIEPVPILLGTTLGTSNIRDEHQIHMDRLTAQHIPLSVTLKKFLEQPGIINKLLNYVQEVVSEKTFLLSYINAKNWSNFDPRGKTFLPLFLYSDDFECGNCIGTHRTIHKITGLYVGLPFLPPEFMSHLQNIFMTYLHHSLDRHKIRKEILYECVITEFQSLYNDGISIETPDFNGKIHFKLALILGDNLGLHELLGFVEGFTANYPCRICKVLRANMIVQCTDDKTLWRNRENYAADVAKNCKTDTGIVEECAWNSVPTYHCCESTGFDIMHDCLLGACVKDLELLITHYMRQKFFDLDALNTLIKFFDYGPIDKDNKPPLMTIDDGKIKISVSAAESLTLTKYFGLIVGHLIPKDDEHWKLYLLLRQILDILLSPFIPLEHLKLLESYITEHHETYLDLSETKRLTNKMHHMIHYPTLIEHFGPPIHFWSMRYEAYHRFPKSIATSISTRRNLTFSLAKRAQLAFRSYLKCNSFFSDRFDTGIALSCKMSEVEGFNLIVNATPPEDSSIQVVPWVKIKGTVYKKNMILVSGYHDHDLPIFAQIKTILLTSSDSVAFVCSSIKTLCFDLHYYAFEVQHEEHIYTYVKLADIPHDFPTAIHLSGDRRPFITYRYGL